MHVGDEQHRDDRHAQQFAEAWPNLLLYATLKEVSPFMKQDERMPVWDGMYQQLKQSITADDLKKVVDRSVTRQEA
jgi:hypothetical protein